MDLSCGGFGESEDSASVDVFAEWVELDVAVESAGGDDGEFSVKLDEAVEDGGDFAECFPCLGSHCGIADEDLSFAVVAEGSGFED